VHLSAISSSKNYYLNNSSLSHCVRNSSVSLSLTWARNEKVEYYIRIKTHKHIALRFWIESGVNALCGWAHVSLVLYLQSELRPLFRPNTLFPILFHQANIRISPIRGSGSRSLTRNNVARSISWRRHLSPTSEHRSFSTFHNNFN